MNYKRILYTILFVFISFLILLRLFTKEYYNGRVDFIYTLVFLSPILIILFFNNWGIKKLLLEKRHISYSIFFLFLAILGITLHYISFDLLSPALFKDYYFISMPIIEIAQYVITFLLISLMLTITSNWFDLRSYQHQLEREKNETQLNNLKAQLNPHFLFNSLNNIYSITGRENKEARNYILKLADALRYMLYKTSSKTVLLADEIEYLENYIGLEKLRLESNASIQFIKNNINENTKVAPLIFLPLVENCFKHCNKSEPEIKIEITQKENELKMSCINNISSETSTDGGLGQKNLKERLEILYPNQHKLKYKSIDNIFNSSLILKLK